MRAARPVAATTRSAASVSSALPSARRRTRTPVIRSPCAAGGQPESVAAIDQRDARQLPDAAAHVALDERPARESRAGARRCAGQLMAADHEAHLLERRAGRRPGGGQLGAEARQQRVEAAPARAAGGRGRGGPAAPPGGPRGRPAGRRARSRSPARRPPRATGRPAARPYSRRSRRRAHRCVSRALPPRSSRCAGSAGRLPRCQTSFCRVSAESRGPAPGSHAGAVERTNAIEGVQA